MISPVSSSLSTLAAASQSKAPAPPPKPKPAQDTVQLSPAAQKAVSGDADHDGDSH
jgi:hypothetical protein